MRNRESYIDRMRSASVMSDDTNISHDENPDVAVNMLDAPFNSKMGCESDDHSSEDNLSSCDFTCIKCKSMWHEACLIKITKRFNMHLYDKNKQLCVNCWKKREWFVREDFQDWKSINLSFL